MQAKAAKTLERKELTVKPKKAKQFEKYVIDPTKDSTKAKFKEIAGYDSFMSHLELKRYLALSYPPQIAEQIALFFKA